MIIFFFLNVFGYKCYNIVWYSWLEMIIDYTPKISIMNDSSTSKVHELLCVIVYKLGIDSGILYYRWMYHLPIIGSLYVLIIYIILMYSMQ